MKEKTAMERAIEILQQMKEDNKSNLVVFGVLKDLEAEFIGLLPAELKQLEDAWSSGFTSHYFIENF